MSEAVKTRREGGILEITLDRPKVNAIDRATSIALGEAFCELRDDPALRVAIVTAAGEKAFSAGWDLKAAASGEDEEVGLWWETDYGPGSFAGITELWDLNKPVIAAVNGLAIGGGLELAIACDLIVCAEHAYFALPEVPLGIVPDSGGLQRVPKRLPYNIAMEMLLLGRRMEAREAMHYGMINAVVPADELMPKAREWARTIAEGAPLAVQSIKEIMRETESMSVRESFEFLRKGQLELFPKVLLSEDAKEGVAAFAEKRKADFKGK
ncbi:carnitinyl-CoA dehydratase [Ferruginivarius sediminum]|uniref:Crotonobetainyl-CoA hydratase n=1 Tax=Ferruginivarius sediminum TaxID=2661937 RepID=A0A369T4U6_9PROT|nr:carnitinyl-CoA dehydratase [Ferruginivarius sediminum]RDD60268.1 crotonobetainyl-CoA hydratase [Ferruginivarius sediminum]